MAGAHLAAVSTDTSIAARLGYRKVGARRIPRIYKELPWAAGHYVRIGPVNHALQLRGPANEVSVRLVQQPLIPWYGRDHFAAVVLQHTTGTSLKHQL
jgi:hypothetical protein